MKFRDKLFLNLYDRYYELQKTILNLGSVGVEITKKCNLQCKHCYMNSNTNCSSDELAYEEWVDFFRQLRKYFGNKVNINITGGEPLVRKDIYEILESINSLGFKKVSLATNGLLIDTESIRLLKKLTVGISISLDGFEIAHNYLRNSRSYEKTLEKIKLLVKSDFSYISIKTAVYKKNFADIEKFYRFVASIGVNEWHINPMEPVGRGEINKKDMLTVNQYLELCNFVDKIGASKNEMKVSFEEQNKFLESQKTCDLHCYKRCSAGINSFAVLYNGDIIDCIQDNRDKLVIHGNVKKDNIKVVWANEFSEKRKQGYKFCDNHHFLNILKEQK